MIDITDNKPFALYVRTNKHIQWRYSEYGGRYETAEKAIEAAKEHFGNTPFQYSIENMKTDEVINGSVGF